MKTLRKFILENILNKKNITFYHGTQPKFVNNIKQNGLIDNQGYNQGSYMVSTDFESALFHAYSEEGQKVYVVEFKISVMDDPWLGYPYLWKGEKRNDNSTWLALMEQIPSKYIEKVHEIEYSQ